MTYKNKLAVLYSSCDKNEFLWDGFFLLMKKYWENFDGDIVFNTENKHYVSNEYNFIYSDCNDENNWSARFYKALEKVPTEYVLIILDDFYIDSYVNDKLLSDCMSQMDKNKKIKGFLFSQLSNNEKKDLLCFEKVSKFKNYRINLKVGLWKKNYLMSLCRNMESPWEYEVLMSVRSFLKNGDIYSIVNSEKSKAFPTSEGYLLERGILNVDLRKKYETKYGIHFFEYEENDTINNKQTNRIINRIKLFFKLLSNKKIC